jgi:hypothetical protein
LIENTAYLKEQSYKNCRIKLSSSIGTSFIANTNFKYLKNGGKNKCNGCAIAVQTSYGWRLGLFLSFDPDTDTLKCFIWDGKRIELKEGGWAPYFVFLDLLKNAKNESISNHFKFYVMALNPKHNRIHFLNQVSGPCYGKRSLSPDIINSVDGCIQGSKFGPDLLFPFHVQPPKPSDMISVTLLNTRNIYFPKKNSFHSKKKKLMAKFATFSKPPQRSFDYLPRDVFLLTKSDYITHGFPNISCKDLYLVPYLFYDIDQVKFGLVDNAGLKKIMSLSANCTVDQHNKQVDLYAKTKIALLNIDQRQNPQGMNICVVEKQPALMDAGNPNYDTVTIQKCEKYNFLPDFECAIVSNFVGGNQDMYGAVTVSRWIRWPYIPTLTLKDANLLLKTFGDGYGSRDRAACIGQNLYLGRRASNTAARPAFNNGPGQVNNAEYTRQNWAKVCQPTAEAVTNHLSHQATTTARWLDSIMYSALESVFIGDEEYEQNCNTVGVCRVKIVTQGKPGHCISFANGIHVDSNDALHRDDTTKIRSMYEPYLDSANVEEKMAAEYLDQRVQLFGGFSLPTTCAYTLLQGNKHLCSGIDGEYFFYFVMTGLGCAVRFEDDCCHMFYGDLFSHCTALALFVDDKGIVHYKDSPVNDRMFAWGAGGRNK